MNVEKIVREYIDKTIHMSLGTSNENKPWVSEVHFVYDDNLNLYFRSLASRRHSQEIAKNPNVAGNIVKQHTPDEYPHAIYFEGSASMIIDDQEIDRAFTFFKKKMDLDEEALEEAKSEEGHRIFKITIENWYAFGKFGQPSGQKYELEWNGGRKAS